MAKLIKKEEPTIIWSEDGSHKNKKKSDSPDRPLVTSEYEIHLKRETKSRGGKAVIVLTNLPPYPTEMKKLAKRLRKSISTGGTYKSESIELQGEVADKVTLLLEEMGYRVKKTGG